MRFEISSKDRKEIKRLLEEKFMPNFKSMFESMMKPMASMASVAGMNFVYEQGCVEEGSKTIYYNTFQVPTFLKLFGIEKQFTKSLQEFFDKNNCEANVKLVGD
jgi:hypothetical protein